MEVVAVPGGEDDSMQLELIEIIKLTNAYQLKIAELKQENESLKREVERLKLEVKSSLTT